MKHSFNRGLSESRALWVLLFYRIITVITHDIVYCSRVASRTRARSRFSDRNESCRLLLDCVPPLSAASWFGQVLRCVRLSARILSVLQNLPSSSGTRAVPSSRAGEWCWCLNSVVHNPYSWRFLLDISVSCCSGRRNSSTVAFLGSAPYHKGKSNTICFMDYTHTYVGRSHVIVLRNCFPV